MLEVIEKLLVLQADDQRARQWQRELEGIPKQRQMLKEKLLSAQADYERNTQGLKQNEVDRKTLELEIQTNVTGIQRYKQQMLQTRKNEEYQALGNQIKAAEGVVSDLETRELELMEAADVLQAQATKAKEVLDAARTRLESDAKDLLARETSLKSQLAELAQRRTSLAAEVEPDVLSVYERILAKKGDAAVVPLSHEVCGGCHMKVTATTSGNTRAGKSVVNCENCGRILYQEW